MGLEELHAEGALDLQGSRLHRGAEDGNPGRADLLKLGQVQVVAGGQDEVRPGDGGKPLVNHLDSVKAQPDLLVCALVQPQAHVVAGLGALQGKGQALAHGVHV